MTEDYTAFAGDTLQIAVTVTDEAGAPLPLAGASLIYILRTRSGAELLRKTTEDGQISAVDNVATIWIPAGETTAANSDTLYHELQATDGAGNVSTLLAGFVRFRRTEIAP